jgi:Ni/Fe-hydrogenase 1 B-type cytochrome subunit
MASSAVESSQHKVPREPLYVFEAPVRIWHWLHALSIVVLAVTGYLIANPLQSLGGEASEHFLMGKLRLIHFIAGYVFAIGFVVRIYWGLVGNKYSRELLYLPVWRADWWRDLIEEVKYYLFLRREPPFSVAHNALAQSAMWIFNTVLGVFMIISGFALYGEGLGLGSWADTWFGWAIPLVGGPQELRMLHILGMWLFIVFAIIHIYMAIRADVMGKQSSVRSIIDGWRTYKD